MTVTDALPVPPEPAAVAWPELPVGTRLTVVKLAPDGSETTRYPGEVVAAGAPPPWLAVRARWVDRPVELDGLRFEPGDVLDEFFSPRHRFNAFAVFAPDGHLRGWYANVTHPARLDLEPEPGLGAASGAPLLVWHDLYIDLVALPDGRATVRDEDELAAAGVAAQQPALAAAITAARDELVARFGQRRVPFHQGEDPHRGE